MVQQCLVVEDGDDKWPIDCFAAAGSILQYTFALVKIPHSLWVVLLGDTPDAQCIDALDGMMQFVYIKEGWYHRDGWVRWVGWWWEWFCGCVRLDWWFIVRRGRVGGVVLNLYFSTWPLSMRCGKYNANNAMNVSHTQ